MNAEPPVAAEPGAAADAIVVQQSKAQRDGLFGVLVAVFVAALVRGFTGAETGAGRVAVIVFTGGVIAVLLVLWVRTVQRPSRIEISSEAIRYRGPGSKLLTLSSQSGKDLSPVALGSGRYRTRGITVRGTGVVIPLPFFSYREIRQQCAARGWQIVRPARRSR
jgi:hypothetical protein